MMSLKHLLNILLKDCQTNNLPVSNKPELLEKYIKIENLQMMNSKVNLIANGSDIQDLSSLSKTQKKSKEASILISG